MILCGVFPSSLHHQPTARKACEHDAEKVDQVCTGAAGGRKGDTGGVGNRDQADRAVKTNIFFVHRHRTADSSIFNNKFYILQCVDVTSRDVYLLKPVDSVREICQRILLAGCLKSTLELLMFTIDFLDEIINASNLHRRKHLNAIAHRSQLKDSAGETFSGFVVFEDINICADLLVREGYVNIAVGSDSSRNSLILHHSFSVMWLPEPG